MLVNGKQRQKEPKQIIYGLLISRLNPTVSVIRQVPESEKGKLRYFVLDVKGTGKNICDISKSAEGATRSNP